MFAPLFAAAARSASPPADALPNLAAVSLGTPDGPDSEALCELFTATRAGRHVEEDWRGTDLTRRATLRILLRSGQLAPEKSWSEALRHGVAFGPAAVEDAVLGQEDRTLAWRGLLLRHYSVGAWRRLWAGLVDFVGDNGVTTRADLHGWIADQLPNLRVREWQSRLPGLTGRGGHPEPAENQVLEQGEGVHRDVALLAIGAQRRQTLAGLALEAFRGGKTVRNSHLHLLRAGSVRHPRRPRRTRPRPARRRRRRRRPPENGEPNSVGFRTYGKSKDSRDDLPPIVIGMAVTRDGIPVRVWCWPGNTSDSALIRQVRDDMRDWTLSRIVWVADSGFSSERNRRYLRQGHHAYIIGKKLRSDPDRGRHPRPTPRLHHRLQPEHIIRIALGPSMTCP